MRGADAADRAVEWLASVDLTDDPASLAAGRSVSADFFGFDEPIDERRVIGEGLAGLVPGCGTESDYIDPQEDVPSVEIPESTFVQDDAWAGGLLELELPPAWSTGGPHEWGGREASAGQVLVLSSSAGTLAELRPDDPDGYDNLYYSGYGAPVPPGTAPAEVALDVPGGDFPALPEVTLPAQRPLSGLRVEPTGSASGARALLRGGSLRWSAGGTGSFMTLRATVEAPDGRVPATVDDLESLPVARVECLFADTGEYRLPEELVRELNDAGSTLGELDLYRRDLSLTERDGVLVWTSRTTSAALGD